MTSTGAPKLNIPPSNQTVRVSIIDTTVRCRIPVWVFMPKPIAGHDFLDCPAYAFLVEHSSGQKVLFDLGVRKDIEGFAPAIHEGILNKGLMLEVQEDIGTILEKDGRVGVGDIGAVIWRYSSLTLSPSISFCLCVYLIRWMDGC